MNKADMRPSSGVLIALGIVLIGVIASLAVCQTGGAALVAFLLLVVFNLAGAVVMDFFNRSMGKVIGAMLLLVVLIALPLLWVPDGPAYLRENPLTFGAILIIASYLRNLNQQTWTLYLGAAILGIVHIVISLT